MPTDLKSDGAARSFPIFWAVLILLFMSSLPGAAAQGGSGRQETAIFAGGCFWCMQPPFDGLKGVISTTAGYTGGRAADPSYEEVSAGGTGHAEAVRILFDPAAISYSRLLEVFWHNIDPTTPDRQFCDTGNQYRTAIFHVGGTQRRLALKSKQDLEKSKPFREPIVTEITAAGTFYPAEDYHQNYYRKNPLKYKFYRFNCGRDKRLRELWGPMAGH